MPARPALIRPGWRPWRGGAGGWNGGPYMAAGLLCLACALLTYHSVLARQLAGERQSAAKRLEFFTLSLEGLLSRNEALPNLLGLGTPLAAALDGDARAREEANLYLEAVAREADLSAAYLMDESGLTIAASNWNQPITFLGQSYGFRPYVRDALAGHTGRFYGIGATSGEPGYFLTSGIRGASRAGVIAVKLNLQSFEDALRQSGEAVMAVDREGVVVLSSVPLWRYRVLEPLAPGALARLAQARQYAEQPLKPFDERAVITAGTQEVRLAIEGHPAGERAYSVTRRAVGPLGWQMVVLTDQAPARQTALLSASAATAIAACVFGVFLHLRLQRQRREDRQAAQAALRRASEELEQRIARRTADLTEANAQLAAKVDALKRTEAILQETRDAAVQAGKLAVLGQMSAGMTHELNQPLGALHTLSDNAVLLLEQDRIDEARENLRLIGELSARMGRIVKQLKLFARKEPSRLTYVNLHAAIEHALLMVEARRREVRAQIAVEAPEEEGQAIGVTADGLRLEQVLVNLLRNALDAVEHAPRRDLTLRVARAGRFVRVTLCDTGPGMDADTLARIGEPFFTTKPAGHGLGLGLALSYSIIESFGGRIEAGNAAEGGAEFRLYLPEATA